MGTVEQLRSCDRCAIKDDKGKITDGDFCVILVAGSREKFSRDLLAPPGCIRFWSRQLLELIENCRIYKEQQLVAAEDTKSLVLAGGKT